MDRSFHFQGDRGLDYLARHTGRARGEADTITGRSFEEDARLGAQLIGTTPLDDGQVGAIRSLGFDLTEYDWDQDDPAQFFDRILTEGLSFVEGFTNEDPTPNLTEFMLPWVRLPHLVSLVCDQFKVTARLDPEEVFRHASLRSDYLSYKEKPGNEWGLEDDLTACREGFNSGLVEFYREFDCVPIPTAEKPEGTGMPEQVPRRKRKRRKKKPVAE